MKRQKARKIVVQTRYKLLWWTKDVPEDGEASGQEEFDIRLILGKPVGNTAFSTLYQELYERQDVKKVEIWQFFAGYTKRDPSRSGSNDEGD